MTALTWHRTCTLHACALELLNYMFCLHTLPSTHYTWPIRCSCSRCRRNFYLAVHELFFGSDLSLAPVHGHLPCTAAFHALAVTLPCSGPSCQPVCGHSRGNATSRCLSCQAPCQPSPAQSSCTCVQLSAYLASCTLESRVKCSSKSSSMLDSNTRSGLALLQMPARTTT